MNKKSNQRFVFPDGTFQDFPNDTDLTCVVVDKVPVNAGWKYTVEGDLVETSAQERVEVLVNDLRTTLDTHINVTAQALGYDSVLSAVSYADEVADPVNKAYGLALRQWRSACYKVAREHMGTATTTTTWEDLQVVLPQFVKPEV